MNDFRDYAGHLSHYGVKGMHWGVRRYQNKNGTLTELGKKHYNKNDLIKQINEKYELTDKDKSYNKLKIWSDHGLKLNENGDLLIERNNKKVVLNRWGYKNPEKELKKKLLYISGTQNDLMTYNYYFIEGMLRGKGVSGLEEGDDGLRFYDLKKDMKIAGIDTVINTILNDPNTEKRYNYLKKIDDLYNKAQLNSMKGLFDTIDDEDKYKKLQKDVDNILIKFDDNTEKYSDELIKKGYDACIDIMDSKFAELPIVMFYPDKTLSIKNPKSSSNTSK